MAHAQEALAIVALENLAFAPASLAVLKHAYSRAGTTVTVRTVLLS